MKLRIIATAAILAATGQAFALTPAQVADASTVKVYMSGATALRNVIGGLFTQHCSGDLDVYYSGIGTFSGVSFAANGDAHRVYTCTMTDSSPILPGKKVALFKSDLGGSGQGVFPVYFEADRNFLNLNTCGARAATVPNYVCTGEQVQVPMAGISDVEPGLFKGPNVPPDDPTYPADGLSDDQLAELAVTPLFQTVFGVAVSKNLRDAMQTAQGLTTGSEDAAQQPSISQALATSYFAGVLADPANGLGWQPLVGSADPLAATRVNVCRRVNGSGTQASANAQFMQFPCNGSAKTPADASYSDAGLVNDITNAGPNGNLFVFEGSSTGNVISCLNTAQANGAYAIGHVSKENAPGSANWRHVKLDGIAPSRDAVRSGLYSYFFESTMQWKSAKFDTLAADQQDFLLQFAAEAGKPTSLAKLSTTVQEGVAALPFAYDGAFGTGTAEDIKFGSRVSRGGNSCSPVTLFK